MEELMGTIKLFAGNFAPQGYAFCDGRLLKIGQYQALFSIISNMYGGDGKTTFALPDLRSRIPVGVGQGKGLSSYTIGDQKGSERNELLRTDIPALQGIANLGGLDGKASGSVSTSSSATIQVPCSTLGNSDTPVDNVVAIDSNTILPLNYATSAESGKFMKPLTANIPINFNINLPITINGVSANVIINQEGKQTPVNNIQPSLGLNYIICLIGTYPNRNS